MSQTFEEKVGATILAYGAMAAMQNGRGSTTPAQDYRDAVQAIIKLIDEHYVPKDESYAYQLVVAEFEALLNRYKDWDYAQERLYEYKKAIKGEQ